MGSDGKLTLQKQFFSTDKEMKLNEFDQIIRYSPLWRHLSEHLHQEKNRELVLMAVQCSWRAFVYTALSRLLTSSLDLHHALVHKQAWTPLGLSQVPSWLWLGWDHCTAHAHVPFSCWPSNLQWDSATPDEHRTEVWSRIIKVCTAE